MLTRKDKNELVREIAGLREELEMVRAEKSGLEQAKGLTEEVGDLKKKIADLKVEESRLTEKHAREKRETEHMVGLERKRQTVEAGQIKKETALEVREQNLAAERERFEEQMKFIERRLETENGYVREMLGQVLDRLPTVTVDRTINESMRTTKKEATA